MKTKTPEETKAEVIKIMQAETFYIGNEVFLDAVDFGTVADEIIELLKPRWIPVGEKPEGDLHKKRVVMFADGSHDFCNFYANKWWDIKTGRTVNPQFYAEIPC